MFDPEVDAVDDELGARPSVGQMIAGVKQPSSMPAIAQPPVPDSAPVVRPPMDPNAVPDFIRPRPIAPNQIAEPPSPSENSNLASLAKQQAQLSQPINPYDPATGKLKPQYKMGVGSKILYTISNALQGFGAAKSGRPFTPVDVGPGATNWKFGREEDQRQKQLEGINTQIGTQEKLQDENEKLYRDAARQAYEGQLGEARLGTSKAQQETADVRQQLADLKANQPAQDKIGTAANERTALADKMGLKGQARTDYILTGKLPKEFINPNAPKRGSKFDFDKIERDKQKAMKDAEAKATAAIAKLNKPPTPMDPEFNNYIANKAGWMESKKQEIYAQLEKEKAQAQSDYEDRIEEKGGSISPESGKNSPQPKNATPAATRNLPPPTVGKTIPVGGRPFMVTGINPKTKKPQGYYTDGK